MQIVYLLLTTVLTTFGLMADSDPITTVILDPDQLMGVDGMVLHLLLSSPNRSRPEVNS